MPRDSLKKLLGKFPYFFDKRDVSNFYRSQDVSNKQFQDIYQSLFNVAESFRLNKRCLVWREQVDKYDYVVNFVVNYPHLKTVKCYKNDEVIYMETYNYEDNINTFFYSYDSTTLNDDSEIENIVDDEITYNIIPDSRFVIEIETYDEISISKGFPENDTIQNNIYDHDTSLDRFGELNSIPRKKYIPSTDYYTTEPLFNNCLTEDDYHYMNRILNYNLRLHNTPLPILEIWKSYGVEAEMLNRERLLLKVFDENKHPFEDGYVLDWEPEAWEHKDGVCKLDNMERYFFVKLSSNFPKKGDKVYFDFKLRDNLFEVLNEEFTVNAFIDDVLFKENIHKTGYIDTYELNELESNIICFVAYQYDEVIGECFVEIQVQGCLNADWYVNEATGDDGNDGSMEHPFKTLNKACESVTSASPLIVVQNTVNLSSAPVISKDTVIMGCVSNSGVSTDCDYLFSLTPGVSLTVMDVSLNGNYVDNSVFVNENGSGLLHVLTNSWKQDVVLSLSVDKSVVSKGDLVTFNVHLVDENGDAVVGRTVILDSVDLVTDENGDAEYSVRANQTGVFEFDAVFFGDEVYRAVRSAPVILTVKSYTLGEVSLTSDKSVLSYYDGDVAVLTAFVTDTRNEPVAGETVYFETVDGEVLGSAVTDEYGEATVSYLSKGSGDLNIRARVRTLLSETYSIEDCIYYHLDEIEYNSSSTLVAQKLCDLPNINLIDDLVLEFDIKSNGTGGGLNIGATNQYNPPSTANYRVFLGTDTNKFSFNNRSNSSSNSMIGTVNNNTYYHMKLEKTEDSFEAFYEDTSIASKTCYWLSNYSEWCLYWINWNDTNYIKNIKIKTL